MSTVGYNGRGPAGWVPAWCWTRPTWGRHKYRRHLGRLLDATRPPMGAVGTQVTFRRGWPERVLCEADWWLAHGDAILAREPVERVTLTTWPGHYYFLESQGHHLWVIPEVWHPAVGSAACLTSERPRVVGNLLTDRWPGVAFTLPPEPVQRWQVTEPDGTDASSADWLARHIRDAVARGAAEHIDRQFRAG